MECYETIKGLITQRKLVEAIRFCEAELAKFKSTQFHWILGKDLLNVSADLLTFIDHNFRDPFKLEKTRAFYSELNEFSINPDRWFFDIVAYDKIDDFQNEHSNWLLEGFWGSHPEYFEIIGWETLQDIFKNYHERKAYRDKQLKKVSELTEFLVVLRFQELFEKTIRDAKRRKLKWAEIPWGITAHEYHLVYEIRV